LKVFLRFSFDIIGFFVYTAYMNTRTRFRKGKHGKIPRPMQPTKPKRTATVQVAAEGSCRPEVKAETTSNVQGALDGAPVPDVKAETTPTPQVAVDGPPPQVVTAPPEMVFRDAMEEPDRRLLEEYGDSIRVLRNDKRFSFREIAEWLQEYGIECDHNSVYRQYTKGLSDDQEREEAYRDAQEENEIR
jgi:hypothetical protein